MHLFRWTVCEKWDLIGIGINYQQIVKHPADIQHQESIVRLTFTPVIPSPFAKKD